MLQLCKHQGSRGAKDIMIYVIADRTSMTSRVHRVKWGFSRRIGISLHVVRIERVSPG